MTDEFDLAPDRRWLAEELREALRLLAARFPDQVAALPDFVVVADEVALVFDDVYSALDPAELPAVVRDELRELDVRLAEMSEDPSSELWTTSALEHDPRWEWIRARARHALDLLGLPLAAPRVNASGYVESGHGIRRVRRATSELDPFSK